MSALFANVFIEARNMDCKHSFLLSQLLLILWLIHFHPAVIAPMSTKKKLEPIICLAINLQSR